MHSTLCPTPNNPAGSLLQFHPCKETEAETQKVSESGANEQLPRASDTRLLGSEVLALSTYMQAACTVGDLGTGSQTARQRFGKSAGWSLNSEASGAPLRTL